MVLEGGQMTTEQPYYGNAVLALRESNRWRIWIAARRAQALTRWAVVTTVAVTLFIYFL